MAKYVLVHENGYLEEVFANGYKDMQRYVEGIISMPWEGDKLSGKATIVANDEAIIFGMEYNSVASFMSGQDLFGPILIGGPTNNEGEIQDVNSDDIYSLFKLYLQEEVA